MWDQIARQAVRDASADWDRVIAPLEDFDGDGVLEVARGDRRDTQSRGVVEVVNGASGKTLWRVEGALPGDQFGQAIVVMDDLDGDGYRDLAVGAPATESLGDRPGDVVLLSSMRGEQLGFLSTTWSQEHEFGAALAFDERAHRLYVGVPGAYSTHGGDEFGGVDVFELPSFERALRVRFGAEHCMCRDQEICLPRGFGSLIAPLNDFDGDGTRDFLAVAREMGFACARAYALSGADGHLLLLWDE